MSGCFWLGFSLSTVESKIQPKKKYSGGVQFISLSLNFTFNYSDPSLNSPKQTMIYNGLILLATVASEHLPSDGPSFGSIIRVRAPRTVLSRPTVWLVPLKIHNYISTGCTASNITRDNEITVKFMFIQD